MEISVFTIKYLFQGYFKQILKKRPGSYEKQ